MQCVPRAVVELLGWDEAFVGIDTDDAERTARDLQAAVLAASRLPCSVGIGDTLTFDAAVIAETARDLLRRLEEDRPIRLLGIRGEMVPPEGGYDPPRTHGRSGGTIAVDPKPGVRNA